MHRYNSKQLHILSYTYAYILKKLVEQVEKSFLQNEW